MKAQVWMIAVLSLALGLALASVVRSQDGGAQGRVGAPVPTGQIIVLPTPGIPGVHYGVFDYARGTLSVLRIQGSPAGPTGNVTQVRQYTVPSR